MVVEGPSPIGTLTRPRVVVIDERPGEASRLCQLLKPYGVAGEAVELNGFLEPLTALMLLLGRDLAAVVLRVSTEGPEVYLQRVCAVRRLARLCGVPFVVTTSTNGMANAVGPTMVIEERNGGELDTLAAAVARFVCPAGSAAAPAWRVA